jgi:hypothetical protein
VGATAFLAADSIGGTTGFLLVFIASVLIVGAIYLTSRRTPVNHHNVNEPWTQEGGVVVKRSKLRRAHDAASPPPKEPAQAATIDRNSGE